MDGIGGDRRGEERKRMKSRGFKRKGEEWNRKNVVQSNRALEQRRNREDLKMRIRVGTTAQYTIDVLCH